MKILRKRLTRLYTITTGALLLLVMAAFFLSSVKEARDGQLEQFQMIWNSLSSRFQSSNAITHGYLAQTEADYQTIIHMRENGIPFLYQGSWTPATDRDILICRAVEAAQNQGVSMDAAPVSSLMNLSSLMTIEGDRGDQYYARILSLSVGKGVRGLCVITYIPPLGESLKGIFLYLCLLGAGGVLGLWLISWYFVGWSLKPVEESQAKQARFIASASHELRSPLAVLRSAGQAIKTAPEETDSFLSLIDRECKRMARLVDDLLLLASADAKTWSIQKEEVDMDTLLIDLCESYEPAWREKSLSLRLILPDQALPKVFGDPDRIRQILMILLDNAKAYAPAGSLVTLEAFSDHKKHALVLEVRDQGCGISDENKPYIFDRFYRADKARNHKEHFGLGLSIAKELVLLHRGSISVKDGEHGGTCFSVILPFTPSSSPCRSR
ncbi:MAG: HAMP domain-containing histidine kinase [Hungatella sp.]|nr:HAMP domain-containing histidine kinase [Hungatella sp.]